MWLFQFTIPLKSHASSVILTFSLPISCSHVQNINSYVSDSIPLRLKVQVSFSYFSIQEVSNHNHNQLLNVITITSPISQSYYIFIWNVGYKYQFELGVLGSGCIKLVRTRTWQEIMKDKIWGSAEVTLRVGISHKGFVNRADSIQVDSL